MPRVKVEVLDSLECCRLRRNLEALLLCNGDIDEGWQYIHHRTKPKRFEEDRVIAVVLLGKDVCQSTIIVVEDRSTPLITERLQPPILLQHRRHLAHEICGG